MRPLTRSRLQTGRRFGIIAVDQAVAGGSNVLLILVAANKLPAHDFGLFSVVVLSYALASMVVRALVCEPLLAYRREVRDERGSAVGAVALVGLIIGSVTITAGLTVWLFVAQELGQALVATAVALPLLSLQDLGRYLSFSDGRPLHALWLDTTWLMLMVVCLMMLWWFADITLLGLTTCWAAPGTVVGLFVLWRHRERQPRLSFATLQRTWQMSWRLLMSYFSGQGISIVASFSLAAIAGPTALGAVRGALLLVRPISALLYAIQAGSLSESSRRPEHADHTVATPAVVSSIAAACALLNILALLWLPSGLGMALLGDTWRYAEPLLLPAGIQMAALGTLVGARAALISDREVRTVLRVDLVIVMLVLVLSLAGAVWAGAWGYYWGMVVSQAIGAVLWWLAYARHTSRTATLEQPRGVSVGPGDTS